MYDGAYVIVIRTDGADGIVLRTDGAHSVVLCTDVADVVVLGCGPCLQYSSQAEWLS